MRVHVLIENTTDSKLVCEHGLSLFIEFEDKKYLLDAGTTDKFIDNAKKMGVPLSDVRKCILSHGHYDHSGGFAAFLAENETAKVYAMKQAKEEYYSGSGGIIHEIGVPKEVLANFGDRFCFIEAITKLDENVYLVPHSSKGLEQIGQRTKLYKKVNGQYEPDDFAHELSLVFDTENGLVIFNSCSHAGIKNIIEEVKTTFPRKQIYAFLGGLHMKGVKDGQEICSFSEEEVAEIAEYLKREKLSILYTGHCTGEPAIELLQKYMGDRVKRLVTGRVLEI